MARRDPRPSTQGQDPRRHQPSRRRGVRRPAPSRVRRGDADRARARPTAPQPRGDRPRTKLAVNRGDVPAPKQQQLHRSLATTPPGAREGGAPHAIHRHIVLSPTPHAAAAWRTSRRLSGAVCLALASRSTIWRRSSVSDITVISSIETSRVGLASPKQAAAPLATRARRLAETTPGRSLRRVASRRPWAQPLPRRRTRRCLRHCGR